MSTPLPAWFTLQTTCALHTQLVDTNHGRLQCLVARRPAPPCEHELTLSPEQSHNSAKCQPAVRLDLDSGYTPRSTTTLHTDNVQVQSTRTTGIHQQETTNVQFSNDQQDEHRTRLASHELSSVHWCHSSDPTVNPPPPDDAEPSRTRNHQPHRQSTTPSCRRHQVVITPTLSQLTRQ